jgi:hypothetical protein
MNLLSDLFRAKTDTEPSADYGKRMFDAGRRVERRRPRKSGSAIDARAYNHHIAMRLTYYEASILDRMFRSIFVAVGTPGMFKHPEDKKAFGRLLRKVRKAGSLERPLSQWEKQNHKAAELAHYA